MDLLALAPEIIQANVLGNLSVQELCIAETVCKKWKAITNKLSETLYKSICACTALPFPYILERRRKHNQGTGYKQLYIFYQTNKWFEKLNTASIEELEYSLDTICDDNVRGFDNVIASLATYVRRIGNESSGFNKLVPTMYQVMSTKFVEYCNSMRARASVPSDVPLDVLKNCVEAFRMLAAFKQILSLAGRGLKREDDTYLVSEIRDLFKKLFFEPLMASMQAAVTAVLEKNPTQPAVLTLLADVKHIYATFDAVLDVDEILLDSVTPSLLSGVGASGLAAQDIMMISSNQKAIPVMRASIIAHSEAIRDILELAPTTSSIQLYQTTELLEKVKVFVEAPLDTIFPNGVTGTPNDIMSDWARDFFTIGVTQAFLFELILFANQYVVKNLLDCACKTVADMIRGKTPEEIRKTFNIVNDFTPEEEEAIRKENEWCEDY